MQMLQRAKQLREQGQSYQDIANALGVSKTTVRRHLMSSASATAPTSFDVCVKNPTTTNQQDSLHELIMQLAPIHYDAPVIPKAKTTPNDVSLVIGDTHFGSESQVVLDLFLSAVAELKPKQVILNGDTLDMLAISRYPKDVRHTQSLMKERESYHRFLKQLHDITVSWNADIIETNSNHSGDGNEGRWWRYLSDRIGELASLPDIKQHLSYSNVFLPHASWSRIKLVDWVEVAPGFLIMHGDVVRRHGGYSARGLLEKWYTSLMCNHTHRIGMTAQRIPSIGSQQERIIRVYENGCACDLNPVYASGVNWQNAFSVICHSDSDVAVETVTVTNRRAPVATLGKTLSV